MKNYKGYILDLDGVVYRGNIPIKSAIEFINKEKEKGKKFYFLTNNSTKFEKEYKEKLIEFGIKNVLIEEIITSATVTQNYLKKHNFVLHKNKILCITENPVKEKLKEIGYEILNEENYKNADFVVVGESDFTKKQLYYAVNAIKHYGAFFIGTNSDIIDPVENGESKPVAGAVLAYIKACTDIEPKILGKPLPSMYELVLERIKIKKEEVLMIGDRLDTDILGANEFGIDTALVETGIHKKVDCELFGIHPLYIINNLNEIEKL